MSGANEMLSRPRSGSQVRIPLVGLATDYTRAMTKIDLRTVLLPIMLSLDIPTEVHSTARIRIRIPDYQWPDIILTTIVGQIYPSVM